MFKPTQIAAVAVGGLVALIATGCTSGSAQSSEPERPSTIKKATFVNPLPDYPAWKLIGECMADEAKKNGIELTQSGQTGSSVDTTYMIDRFQQATAIKTDAIITFPISADQFDPLFKTAKAAGIYTATVEGGQTVNNDLNAGTSFDEYGKLAAATIAKKAGEKNVGFITAGPTGPDAIFIESFKKWALENPSANIKVIDTRFDGGDPTKTPDLANAMLTAHPELNMFVTNEGAATQPIISAIKQNGLKDKVFLTTNSKYSGSLEGLEEGYVYSFLVQDMCDIGAQAIRGLVKFAAGDLQETNIATGIDFATKENYKELLADGRFQ